MVIVKSFIFIQVFLNTILRYAFRRNDEYLETDAMNIWKHFSYHQICIFLSLLVVDSLKVNKRIKHVTLQDFISTRKHN